MFVNEHCSSCCARSLSFTLSLFHSSTHSLTHPSITHPLIHSLSLSLSRSLSPSRSLSFSLILSFPLPPTAPASSSIGSLPFPVLGQTRRQHSPRRHPVQQAATRNGALVKANAFAFSALRLIGRQLDLCKILSQLSLCSTPYAQLLCLRTRSTIGYGDPCGGRCRGNL